MAGTNIKLQGQHGLLIYGLHTFAVSMPRAYDTLASALYRKVASADVPITVLAESFEPCADMRAPC